jgi:hypothetical protein
VIFSQRSIQTVVRVRTKNRKPYIACQGKCSMIQPVTEAEICFVITPQHGVLDQNIILHFLRNRGGNFGTIDQERQMIVRKASGMTLPVFPSLSTD